MAMKGKEAFYKELGARLAAARADAHLTQNELAEMLGVAQQTLAHYETGRLRISVQLLLEASKVLRFSVDEMLAKDGAEKLPQRLRVQFDAVAELPRPRQKFVVDLLDSVLAKWRAR